MWPVIGGLLSGGASLLGGLFNTSANNQNAQEMQQQAEAFNAQQVQQQENFQQTMSSTAYQRASQDMQAAGLNPAMMFGSGSAASTPGGSSTSIQPAQKTSAAGAIGDSVSKAISSAVALKTADATIDNLVADNAKIKADILNRDADTALKMSTDKRTAAEIGRVNADTALTQSKKAITDAELPVIVNQALTAKNEGSMDPSARRTLDVLGYGGRKSSDILDPVGNVVSSALGAKRLIGGVTHKSETTRSDDGSSTFNERWSSQ